MIPQETISRIIEGNDIVAIVSEHVMLQKRGVNYIGCCPFHSEKTGSFTVSPAKGIYKCFGCGKSGNVVQFVLEINNISWIEAIKTLAEKAKIDLPKRDITPEEKMAIDSRERLFIINQFAAKTWKNNFEASPGRTYMMERGFDDTDFEAFGIGYAPESWDFLKDAATKAGHKNETLLEAGLIARSENSNKLYDRFRDRVIFPILNTTGRIAGFTGRVLVADDKTAKYLNTPETTIYHKSELLFGLFQAKNAIVKEGRCNLVEGNTDVMRWHKVGMKNTVGSCGTAITAQHAKLIHRFTNNVNIVLDGDSAGLKATLRSIDIFVAEGLNVYVTIPPAGEDPDSFARGMTYDALYKWIEENEKDFILFRAELAAEERRGKPAEEARIMNELRDTINKVPDEVTRNVYIKEVARIFQTDEKIIAKGITPVTSDIFGSEANAEAIKREDEVFIYLEKEECMEAISEGKENAIAIPGHPLKPEHIGEIEVLTKNLVFMDELPATIDITDETENIKDIKKLLERGFRISVIPPSTMRFDENKVVSFVEVYFQLMCDSMDPYNTESQREAIEKCAEFLSKQDKTTISIKTGVIAKSFGITKAAFEQILKPFVNAQKSKATIGFEKITIDNKPFTFDVDNMPDYVDHDFFNKFRHFPVQNEKGIKIFYMFQGENSQLFRVANFYMEPLFQVRSDDPLKNKRIVKLNHADLNNSQFMEIKSDDMVEFGAFKKFLWRQGPYNLRNAKPQHLDMILDSIALDFPVTDELEIFGQQEEGFYAFCNAIFADGQIHYMNDLGLISFKRKTYYSPSVSIIYKDLRKDNDKYAQDRYFIYRETNNINFDDWAKLMMQVYKYNDNGYWSVIMTIMIAFRSDIFAIDRLFTTLFLIGPTGCGKSELAQSIRAIYMHHEAPMFNLNSGTDAAFFTMLERYRDAPVIMEEYNDMYISDAKFQGLKAAVYDGEGKTKRKDATSKDLDTSKVNAVPIILGQESPERDDGSLGNRAVLLQVKKVEFWTDDENDNFQRLKKLEKQGLTNLLIDILKQREVVHTLYVKKLRLVHKQFRDDLKSQGEYFDTRVLNTIALFASMVKLIEEEVNTFHLPFTYNEFYPIARKKLVDQSGSIQQTNRLSVFLDTMLMLSEDTGPRRIVNGKDYKIETHDCITVGRGKDEELKTFNGYPTKLLFLRIDMIHPKYKAQVGDKEHLKMNNLMTYIKDHPAYVGQIKTTTFRWKNETRTDNGNGTVMSVMTEEIKRTSATVMNYDMMRDYLDLGECTTYEIPSGGSATTTESTDNRTEEEKQKDLPF